MSLRNSLLLLMILCGIGVILNYSIADFIQWAKYSVVGVVFLAVAVVIIFGLFAIFICAQWDQYRADKDRKLYNDTNDIYDDQDYN
jgi:hypothetical protein